MRKNRSVNALCAALFSMILFAYIAALPIRIGRAETWFGYVKPSYPNYAPSGVPDFDQKQDAWGPGAGTYTWCGPVAVANSLWWLDSKFDPSPLVTAYPGVSNDHDPANVDPLVRNLASLMDTDGQTSHDGHLGTRWTDLQNGINLYIGQQGLTRYFEVHSTSFPDFGWVNNEIQNSQDVELFLEFYKYTVSGWVPLTNPVSLEAGHFVTCAGVDGPNTQLLICDPLQDAYEAGAAPKGGRSPISHLYPHGPGLHNNASYVSQDAYQASTYSFFGNPPPPPPPAPPAGYPPTVLELVGYLQTMPGFDATWHAFVRAAVATSPKEVSQWQGYIKPPYPDYAPSAMPDIDEKQDNWGPAAGMYTWCVPVAVANSLWWLDSEYESIYNPSPVAPPTISDHFPLVSSYNPTSWDDHDAQNVDPLVRNLAFLMDTDGQHSGDGHIGTRVVDAQNGIQQYLIQQGTDTMFEAHSALFPALGWIDNEIERCQDVVIFLEFWRFTGGPWEKLYDNPSLEFGHAVTCAGINFAASQLLISDPYQDAFEAGTAPQGGRSPVMHGYPHPSMIHNDAQYVSQDAYSVATWVEPPPSPYPGTPLLELVGYLQTLGYDPSWHAFITAAVVTSPTDIHDIAVTEVTTSKDGCTPLPTVCENYTAEVYVKVKNNGNQVQSFFDVTCYVSNLTGDYGFATQTISLDPGENTALTFLWNTHGYARGAYTVWAHAEPVPGETNTGDNTCTDGTLTVVHIGDLNADNKINILDIVKVALGFSSHLGDPRWDPNADINGDKVINILDIVIIAVHFGETYL